MSSPNRYAVGVSTNENFDLAAAEVIGQLTESMTDGVDLLSFFCVGYPEESVSRFSEHSESLSAKFVAGSNCMGTLAGQKEYFDGEPTLVAWAARMPETQMTQFHLRYRQSSEGGAFVGWPDDSSCLEGDCVLLTIADPFSFPVDLLLHRLNEDRPNVLVVGGMASGVSAPGDWSVFDADGLKHEGATVIAFQGNHLPIPLVSQGCRPIGQPMVITDCERNEIRALGGVPAAQKLIELFDQLPTREQKLLNSGLHIGFAVTEYQDSFGYGDFLIRNVIGFDRSSGTLNVGAFARVGQTVQFHVRDHATATVDLNEACDRVLSATDTPAKSALVFTCNGRGTHLFPEPDHDALLLSNKLKVENLAGFFAAGEVGPVGGENHVHGYTASVAIFT